MKIINLPYTSDLTANFKNIANFNWSIWLDSAGKSNYDIISAFPYKIITSNLNSTIVKDVSYDNKLNILFNNFNLFSNSINTPFDIINNYLKKINNFKNNNDNNIPFWHGALGCFGYDLNQILYPKLKKLNYNNIPVAAVGIYAWALISDHKLKKTYIAYDEDYIEEHKITYILELLTKNNQSNNINNNIYDYFIKNPISFNTDISLEEYSYNFAKIQQYIKNGDCYQINYCLPFSHNLFKDNHKYYFNSWDIYNYLKSLNPNPFGCYFKISNNTTILSYSPERFIKINNNKITTEPIKGTRPNVINNTELNNQYKQDLITNSKDRAENIMITDLMRNDLNKHCIAGTVKTEEICKLHSFPTVHHLISKVNGIIKPDLTSVDVFKGCFPGGSITGAPKLRAMQIIQELENSHHNITRYIYCGSIGYINNNFNLDMNIAIRTAVINNNTIHYWAGSGIVADSDCNDEYREILSKLIKTIN